MWSDHVRQGRSRWPAAWFLDLGREAQQNMVTEGIGSNWAGPRQESQDEQLGLHQVYCDQSPKRIRRTSPIFTNDIFGCENKLSDNGSLEDPSLPVVNCTERFHFPSATKGATFQLKGEWLVLFLGEFRSKSETWVMPSSPQVFLTLG